MSILSKFLSIFNDSPEPDDSDVEFGILATGTEIISGDFTADYNTAEAERGKFVVNDLAADTFSTYPGGRGKYTMLTYDVSDLDAVDFTQSYNTAEAERGKFVKLNLDSTETGYPSGGRGRYAVLTYNVNSSGGAASATYLPLAGGTMAGDIDMGGFNITNGSLVEFVTASFITELSGFSVAGDVEIDGAATITGLISTTCGTSEEWCSTYATVGSLSSTWGGGGGGGSDVSGLSANWENTYTTVLNNSASNWDNDLTLKLDQTTPQTVINGAPIFNGGIESYLKDYSGVVAVDTVDRTLNDDSGAIAATWDDSGVSIVGCLSTDCIKPQSTTTTPISVHSNLFMVSGGGGIDMQDNPISNLHYIDWHLDDSIPPSEGRLAWNDTDGTLDLGLKGGNVNLQIGQESVLRVRASEDIADGEVVYIDGASGQNPTAAIASKDDLLSSHSVIGVATETIATNNFGYITTQGLVRGIDTSNIPVGNIAYLGTAGALTSSIPLTPDHEVRVGVVINSAVVPNGILYVNVSLGFDINEIHDINITSPQDNDVLLYSSVSSAWLNSDQANNWDSTYTTVLANSASNWDNQNAFATVAVDGDASLVADTPTDTFTLSAEGAITLRSDAATDTIVIGTPAGSGEANTASNIGATGEGVFAQKSGVDLEFKNLVAGSGISITSSPTGVNIESLAESATGYGIIETETDTTFTINTSSGIVLVDASAGAATVNLPPALGNDGRRFSVKKIDATNNTVTLSANTNIDSQPTFIIRQQYDAIEFISNDTQWWII